LAEIFPLRFRLREEMRFFGVGDVVVAEKVRSGQRYSLKPWQYDLLAGFDGKKTFEASAKEIYHTRPGAFTAIGLLNFYNWLYTENLVLCECESIFELVLGDPDEGFDADEASSDRSGISEFAGRLLRDSRVRRTLAVSAAVVFCLAVVRVVYVAAPVFEPPVHRLYAEAARLFEPADPAISVAASERSAEEPSIEKVSLASRVPSTADEPAPTAHDPGEPTVSVGEKTVPAPAAPIMGRIETLRVQLEECRIRRDEFYLQDNEEGYRREVHRMTNLAREIGDIENAR